jgi:hypothetical protein
MGGDSGNQSGMRGLMRAEMLNLRSFKHKEGAAVQNEVVKVATDSITNQKEIDVIFKTLIE